MSALGRIGGGLVFGLVAMLLAGGAEAVLQGKFIVNSGDWTNPCPLRACFATPAPGDDGPLSQELGRLWWLKDPRPVDVRGW
jgi:hypothetical protein